MEYVNIKRKDGGYLNPFLLSKTITHTIGLLTTAKNTKEGLLTRLTAAQIVKINAAKVNGFELVATPNARLNHSKGTIYFPDFNRITEQEIMQELKEQGVIGVERILRKGTPNPDEVTKTGLKNTGIFVLDFNKANKPEHITICFERVLVKTYYPNPRKCNACHRFGHTAKWCKQERRCKLQPKPYSLEQIMLHIQTRSRYNQICNRQQSVVSGGKTKNPNKHKPDNICGENF